MHDGWLRSGRGLEGTLDAEVLSAVGRTVCGRRRRTSRALSRRRGGGGTVAALSFAVARGGAAEAAMEEVLAQAWLTRQWLGRWPFEAVECVD